MLWPKEDAADQNRSRSGAWVQGIAAACVFGLIGFVLVQQLTTEESDPQGSAPPLDGSAIEPDSSPLVDEPNVVDTRPEPATLESERPPEEGASDAADPNQLSTTVERCSIDLDLVVDGDPAEFDIENYGELPSRRYIVELEGVDHEIHWPGLPPAGDSPEEDISRGFVDQFEATVLRIGPGDFHPFVALIDVAEWKQAGPSYCELVSVRRADGAPIDLPTLAERIDILLE